MKSESETDPLQAVVFELENVAANGHAVMYGVLKETLGKKNVELSPAAFARFCLNSTIDKFVGQLLLESGKTQTSAEKLAEEVKKNYVKALSADGNRMPPGLRGIIEGAAAKGITAGALSCLGPEVAESIAGHLGLDSLDVTIRARNTDHGNCVNKEDWIKLTRSVSAQPPASVAITSNSQACKAAVSAGMKVVACPGKHADFADFGGADAVLDVLDKDSVATVLSLLEPRQWS